MSKRLPHWCCRCRNVIRDSPVAGYTLRGRSQKTWYWFHIACAQAWAKEGHPRIPPMPSERSDHA